MEEQTKDPRQAVSAELQKNNVTEQTLVAWEDTFLSLTLNGVNDKEGVLTATEGLKMVSKTRILTEKFCKKGREEAIKIQRLWIEEEKRVATRLSKIEEHLEAELNKVQRELEEKERETRKARIDLLVEFGATFDGADYWLGNRLLTPMLKVTDEFFQEQISELRAAKEQKDALMKQEQEKAAEEKRKLEEEKKALADEMEKMKKQREEMEAEQERLRLEKQEHEAERYRNRVYRLQSIGMVPEVCGEGFSYKGQLLISFNSEVGEKDSGEFDHFVNQLRDKVAEIDMTEAENQKALEKAKAEEERLEKEKQQTMAFHKVGAQAFLHSLGFEPSNGGMQNNELGHFIGENHYSQFINEEEFNHWKDETGTQVTAKKLVMKARAKKIERLNELKPYSFIVGNIEEVAGLSDEKYQAELAAIKNRWKEHLNEKENLRLQQLPDKRFLEDRKKQIELIRAVMKNRLCESQAGGVAIEDLIKDVDILIERFDSAIDHL